MGSIFKFLPRTVLVVLYSWACCGFSSQTFGLLGHRRRFSELSNDVPSKHSILSSPWNDGRETKSSVPTTTSTTRLYSNNGDNNDDDSLSFQFLAVALPLVGIAALWPLLALFRDINDPTSGFDIDMFMALKGILDSGTDGANNMNEGSIIELPPLSPAERLVDAIFGPP